MIISKLLKLQNETCEHHIFEVVSLLHIRGSCNLLCRTNSAPRLSDFCKNLTPSIHLLLSYSLLHTLSANVWQTVRLKHLCARQGILLGTQEQKRYFMSLLSTVMRATQFRKNRNVKNLITGTFFPNCLMNEGQYIIYLIGWLDLLLIRKIR